MRLVSSLTQTASITQTRAITTGKNVGWQSVELTNSYLWLFTPADWIEFA